MKTIEISDAVADAIENTKQEAVISTLISLCQEFIDVTSVGAPQGQRDYIHRLTGEKLTIRATWT